MSDHYVIAARSAAVAESWLRVLDLPDAEHIHITRHPDGTITATPMRRCEITRLGVLADLGPEVHAHELLLDGEAWADCPTGGDRERGA